MKALTLPKPALIDSAPLQLRDLPIPEPAANEIRVRVHACGICRTDLHVVEGDLPPQVEHIVPGHQVVGVVDRRGSAAKRFEEGHRVGIAWLRSTCGECRYCRAGNENLCPQARFTGYHASGGYAEYAVVREDFAYSIPATLGAVAVTPLLCAGIIGYRALRRAEMRAGCRLGLYGFGSSAHIAIQVARHFGCTVYVMTRDERHQALARALGAAWGRRRRRQTPRAIGQRHPVRARGELVLQHSKPSTGAARWRWPASTSVTSRRSTTSAICFTRRPCAASPPTPAPTARNCCASPRTFPSAHKPPPSRSKTPIAPPTTETRRPPRVGRADRVS